MDKSRSVVVQISSGTILKSLALLILLALLFFLRDIVLIVLTAVTIASAIEPGVAALTRRRIPRIAAVLAVYLFIILGLFSVFYFLMPPLFADLVSFFSTLPQYLDTVQASNPLASSPLYPFVSDKISDTISLRELASGIEATLANTAEGLFKTVNTVFGGVLSFVFIIVFSFYFAMQETGIDDFLRVVTPARHHEHVLGLWRRSQKKIGLWMQGQLLLALVVGVLVYLGLTIFGVKYALTLALFAAIMELIPVFGPILSAIPAVIVAFGSGGTSLALIVVGLYVIIQQLENHLIYPLVVTKVVGVPPLLVILALIVGAKLAGFLGIILSVPAAAVVQELVQDLERRRQTLGDVAAKS